ncbi:Disease resistance protein (TIR-NBS-LRR class) family [Arabidopsis thaliana]|uniref:Disease resistance protein (TIR-NBS-LRR class) family n=1 Tax=Arabidopsis thaliana TaxID=3702 RepID=A0A1P8B595_ARATH|nr:Disease resistance protein (TIR-NBS-LRR class) family [Arabidopsis thaliana]ANM66776.1 Disease resistance protein (TIR-NBS-LRR class) family [Arabidopsis thaliana]|eukprot:NP_001328652.1 Disease resistance protein (TIR-NBS-LRR class) family [Arabidopsis thaliana]
MTNSSQSRKPQVFISFRGKAQRKTLVSFIKSKLEEISEINVFMDEYEIRGRPITTLFERIRESSIALVIFSDKYPESRWCLDELVEIKKQMETGSIVPFPIFYKVKAESVKNQTGHFRNVLLKTEEDVRKKVDRSNIRSILETEDMIWGWRQALVSVGGRMGFSYNHKCDNDFVNDIVVQIKKMLADLSPSPRNGLKIIERPQMHPQEEVTSLLQALNLKKSDLEDLIHINGVVSHGTDRLVFLDLISLQNPILADRLIELVQAGRNLLVLLGSLEYYNKGFTFKRIFLPKKSQQLPGYTVVAESNDNLRNHEVSYSDTVLTCFSFLCNILKRSEMKIDPLSQRVFIGLGEKHLGKFLVSSLKEELESNQILVYVEDETKSRIKESGVAVVFFSKKYPNSEKCLDELVEIKKLMDAGKIDPLPVFYSLKDEPVKNLKGYFLNRLLKIENEVRKNIKTRDDKSILDTEAKIWGWRDALSSIASRPGLSYELSTDDVFVSDIVTKVNELFASRERKKTEAATTVVKTLDADDLFYSRTSFLQAIDRDITDFESFTDIPNGLVLLRLKGHTNLVFLKLSSHENLVRFQRSDSFKFLTEV